MFLCTHRGTQNHSETETFRKSNTSDQVQVIINGNTVATLQASIQDFPTSFVVCSCSFVKMFPVVIDGSESNSESNIFPKKSNWGIHLVYVEDSLNFPFSFSFWWFIVHKVYKRGLKD